jgi:hypothetical protein
MRGSILKWVGVVALIAAVAVGWAQSNSAKLNEALAWLKKIETNLSPNVKKDVPAIQAILRRYYLEPESLRATEEDIALAFIDTMPKSDGIGDRTSPLDKLKKFESMMGGNPKPAPKPKPVAGKPKPKPAPPPPKVVVKRKIPGIHSKATFVADSRSAPGGKTIGVVQMNIAGRSKTVVEVLSGTSRMDARKRAQVVASRMQSLSRNNRLWWTMLRVSQVKGQYVVGTGGSNFVITADSAFAKEWGLTPRALASQLILKMRSSLDPEKSEQFGSRDLTAEELRVAAIDLRQQGDALYASNASAAEAKYRAAIANDPTYGVPYLRIADIQLSRNDSTAAKSILQEGLKVGTMPNDQRQSLEAKLRAIG